MKKYKYTKTWVDPVTKRRAVVRSDDEEELWLKYFEKKYGRTFTSNTEQTLFTVREWTEEAVRLYKSNLSDKSLRDYQSQLRANILCYIGDTQIEDVTPELLQETLNKQRGKSNRQISMVYQILRFIFRTAKRADVIPVDPSVDLVKPHGKRKHTRRALTDDERAAFLSVTADLTPTHPLFLFVMMYHTGLRPSEVIHLRGRDIMKIDGKKVLHVRGEKTDAADRYVPLPDSIYHLVSRTRANELVVTKKEHMFDKNDYDNAGRMLRRRMKKAGVVSDFCPYMLRHDFCTRLKKQGVSLRDAQYLMGHSRISITAEIYTHVTAEEVLAAL
jgi:integrase